jgi:hypothetical protein
MSEKIPNKYLTNNPNVMKREIKKHGKKKDGDSSAYGPWDADYKSRKAGKGKKVKTKKSKHTKRYEEMFGEGFSYIMDESEYRKDLKKIEEEFIEFLEDLDEEDSKEIERLLYEGSQKISSPIKKALKKKSDKTGFSSRDFKLCLEERICSMEKRTYTRNKPTSMGNGKS